MTRAGSRPDEREAVLTLLLAQTSIISVISVSSQLTKILSELELELERYLAGA